MNAINKISFEYADSIKFYKIETNKNGTYVVFQFMIDPLYQKH